MQLVTIIILKKLRIKMVKKEKKVMKWRKEEDKKIIMKKRLQEKQHRQRKPFSQQVEELVIEWKEKLNNCWNDQEIIGRESEIKQMQQYLLSPFDGILNIIGSPGTGKTSSTLSLLKNLSLSYLYLNSMQNQKKIEKSEKYQVIVIDQFDQINQKSKYIMSLRTKYPTLKLILISNTASTNNENSLKVEQNIKNLFFLPYQANNLIKIIQHKLAKNSIDCFSEKAVKYAVKRTTQRGKDLRQVINILNDGFANIKEKILELGNGEVLELGKEIIGELDLRKMTFDHAFQHYVNQSSLAQKKLWLIMLKLQKNLPPQKSCSCPYPSLENLYSRKTLPLSQPEIQYTLNQWKNLGYLSFIEKTNSCPLHLQDTMKTGFQFLKGEEEFMIDILEQSIYISS